MSAGAARTVQQASEALQVGDLTTAERLALLVLNDAPTDLSARLILGGACFRSGRFAEAAEQFQTAVDQEPQTAEATLYLAESLRRLDRVVEALHFAERAEQMMPKSLDANYTTALCLISLARFREALGRLERFCKAKDVPIAKHYLAHCLIRTGRPSEAIELLRELRRREPLVVKHAIVMGQGLIALHRYSEAVECGREILQTHPNEAAAHALIGQALSSDGRIDEAEPSILAALKLTPDAAVPNALYGIWLHQMGRFQEADAYFDKALAVDPFQALPLFLKSEGKTFRRTDEPELVLMEEYVASERTNAYEKIALHFGLGKANLDLGNLRQSFEHYDRAHELAYRYYRDDERYDDERMRELVARTKGLFTREFFTNWAPFDDDSKTPVFVTGMIRSGTTLMEQILSAHPDVVGAGELKFWPDEAFKTLDLRGEFIDREKLYNAARRYLELVDSRGKGARRVVDKMPTNWMYTGFLVAALPEAKVVHMLRNPLDIAFSIWMTYISEPPAFASRKDAIVTTLRVHADLARHWLDVLPPSRYLQVSYEALTADPDEVIRKVVEFCGLRWDEACLHPERNNKSVATPSLFRVRKPIDRQAVSKAERYQEFLGEFARLSDG